ncbi:MAG: glycosyltransferase family 2 protein [Deltaproteobacteria bacterium]
MGDRVNVLLSTFNGEKFLPELLDSLSRQTHRNWVLTVRDDGSSDGTIGILNAYRSSFPGMRVTGGANIGVVDSFFTLLREGDPGCDFFAFCDQDDVWNPGKLSDAVRDLADADPRKPAMYCSRVEYVKEDLTPFGASRIPRKTGFGNALVENVSPGCTFVLTAAARKIVVSSLPERAIMHDWWCYLVVSCFGTVLYDPAPQVRYRQHGGNAVGGTSRPLARFLRRANRFLRNPDDTYRVTDQAREFLRCFRDRIEGENAGTLDAFLRSRSGMFSRFRYALSPMGVWRQSAADTWILRLLILLGRY